MKKPIGRPPRAFAMVEVDIVELRGLLREQKVEVRTARRARVLVLRAEGMMPGEIAERVGVNPSTVFRILERYEQGGLGGALMDAPRSGRPPRFSP